MEATMIYDTNTGLIENLKNYIESTGKSITAISKELNYSRSAVSRFLNGDYNSATGELEDAIRTLLKGIEDQISSFVRPNFFDSMDATNIIGVCNSCQKHMGLGLIIGKSGFGKTHTLRHYANMPKVIRIECDDNMAVRDFIEALETKIGLPATHGTIWKRLNNIREFFNVNQGYLLIVDEADKLISKYTQKKIEILRGIYDQADVGLIIAGEPMLEVQLKNYSSRFCNRIDFYYRLRGLSKDEVKNYLKGMDIEEDAQDELTTRAINKQTGCFRLLDRTLNNVLRVSNGETITLDNIRKASAMMML